MKHDPQLSVIIPTLNEERYLPRLLMDLSRQTFTDFEVIVIDADSEDRTIARARKFKTKLNLSVLRTKKKNVSFQRNLGAEQAQGSWIIFMDADNRLPAHFLQGIDYQICKKPQVDIFTCAIDPSQYKAKDKLIVQIVNSSQKIIYNFQPGAMGALIGVRKEITDRVKFDETVSFREDGAFVRSVISCNHRFEFWDDPAYTYSLRRLKKDGSLKLLLIYLEGVVTHSSGEFEKYPMLGGGYYSRQRRTKILKKFSLLPEIEAQLEKSHKLKSLLTKLNNLKTPLV